MSQVLPITVSHIVMLVMLTKFLVRAREESGADQYLITMRAVAGSDLRADDSRCADV